MCVQHIWEDDLPADRPARAALGPGSMQTAGDANSPARVHVQADERDSCGAVWILTVMARGV